MPKSLTDARTPAPTDSVRASEATIASTWLAVGQRLADEDLLDWPPEVFAFTDVILDRAEAYRFVVSPPTGRAWPPADAQAWREDVRTAARRWSAWVEERLGTPPRLVAQEWRVVREALDMPVGAIASGRAWRICEALLTLHAVSDEACAAVAVGTSARGDGIVMRARPPSYSRAPERSPGSIPPSSAWCPSTAPLPGESSLARSHVT